MLGTILFFHMVNWILKSRVPPDSLKDDEWKWRNLYVSWIHAVVVSVWTILSMFLYPELFQDPMLHVNYFTYFNVCLPTAYFVYDFLDMLLHGKVLTFWEVTLHHIVVGGMFYYNVHLTAQIGFNVMVLIVEFNSLFLHWRKLLQMTTEPFNSRRYLVMKYLNLISFSVFRFGGIFIITWSIYAFGHQVSTVYWWCISSSVLFMHVLNVVLFRRLLKGDLLRGQNGRRAAAMDTLRRDWANIWNDPKQHAQSCGHSVNTDSVVNNIVPYHVQDSVTNSNVSYHQHAKELKLKED